MGARAGAPVTIAPRPYVVVPGTWAYADLDNPRAWWQRGSAWSAFLAAAGGLYAMRPLDPFLWSTDLEGFPWPWRRRALDRNDWDAGGRSLRSGALNSNAGSAGSPTPNVGRCRISCIGAGGPAGKTRGRARVR